MTRTIFNRDVSSRIKWRISAFILVYHMKKAYRNQRWIVIFQCWLNATCCVAFDEKNVFTFVLSDSIRKWHLNYCFDFWQRFKNVRNIKTMIRALAFRRLIEKMMFKFWYAVSMINLKFAMTKQNANSFFNSTLIFSVILFSVILFFVICFFCYDFSKLDARRSTFMFFLLWFLIVCFSCCAFLTYVCLAVICRGSTFDAYVFFTMIFRCISFLLCLFDVCPFCCDFSRLGVRRLCFFNRDFFAKFSIHSSQYYFLYNSLYSFQYSSLCSSQCIFLYSFVA